MQSPQVVRRNGLPIDGVALGSLVIDPSPLRPPVSQPVQPAGRANTLPIYALEQICPQGDQKDHHDRHAHERERHGSTLFKTHDRYRHRSLFGGMTILSAGCFL
jgi:hypothetical protein